MTPALPAPSRVSIKRAIGSVKGRAVAAVPRLRTRTDAGVLDRAAFGFLLLAAGDLLFRPADLIPGLEATPIHKLLLIVCTLLALPRLLRVFSTQELWHNAVMILLILMVPAVMLSHLVHGDTYGARIGGVEMAKSCLFALLVIVLTDSVPRLRTLLAAIAAAVFGVAVLAVAQFHGFVHFTALTGVEQYVNTPQGRTLLIRLCGIGLFNDPNDFSLVLVTAMIVCGYGFGEHRAGLWRWALLIPLGLMAYALLLTHSRGGAFSGAVAVVALVGARAGKRSALLLIAAASGAMLLSQMFGHMSLNLADPEDTFQARLRLWSGSLELFMSDPIFGIGENGLIDALGQVAHNSFLQAFAEMGVVGGTLFLGAFAVVGRALYRATSADGPFTRVRPYVIAIVMGYIAGLLSLSRCYAAPTQMVLALGTAIPAIASRVGGAGVDFLPRADWRCMRGIAILSAAFLLATWLFVGLVLQQVET